MTSHYFPQIIQAIHSFDGDLLQTLVKEALEAGINPVTLIQQGIAVGLKEIGNKYETGELFVTHLVVAAEIAKVVIAEVLEPALQKTATGEAPGVKVLLATVQGDIHDIGIGIVGAMLFAAGFNVINIGKDVPATLIVRRVEETKAPLLGLSTLLTTTMPEMQKVIEELKKAGLRDQVKVMVGGGPLTAEWAQQIGADGYGKNAVEAVALAKRLLNLG